MKKGIMILIVTVTLFLGLAFSNYAQALGCCTNPTSAVCEQVDQQSCCGDDQNCIDTQWSAGACPADLCQSGFGCCVDTCTHADYKAECPTTFKAGACESTPECGTGCCKCVNTEDTNDIIAVPEEVTDQECITRCNDYDTVTKDYQKHIFDPSISLEDCTGVAPPPVEQTGTIRAKVQDTSQQPLENALVQAAGESCLTNSNGECSLLLALGSYGVAATKEQYTPQAQTVVLDTPDETKEITFTLTPGEAATFTGTITVIGTDSPITNGRIYIDGILVADTNDQGVYTYSTSTGAHTIQARAAGFIDSPIENIVLNEDGLTKDFQLTVLGTTCNNPSAPPPSSLTADHVPGQKAVQLNWVPPQCNNVAGYYIQKQGIRIAYLPIITEPLTHPTSYLDEDVEWQQSYTYCIEADYTDEQQRVSLPTCSSTLTLGQEICEGKFEGTFSEFCLDRYKRATCNNQNQPIDPPSSSINPIECQTIGASWFCTGPDYEGLTHCKDQGACSTILQQATPFGLFFNEVACYGSNDQNYCYYDTSNSIVDACFPCSAEMSCFNYTSLKACDKDNCQAAGFENECKWQPTSYAGLGKGICYPEAYEKDDQCHRCSKDNALFENTGCTQDICSALGSCFADSEEANCLSCLLGGCEALTSEEACIGNQEFEINDLTDFTLSQDVCNLGRCKWDAETFSCFKDGNDNNDPDCDTEGSDQIIGGNLATECRKDHEPPETRSRDDKPQISADSRIFLISSPDANKLTYCIDEDNQCTPESEVDFTDGVAYLSKDDLLNSNDILNTKSGSFYLRYYATDKNFNQETLKTTLFFADIIPPEISVQISITGQDDDDTLSDLTMDITVDELATCQDELIIIDENCGEEELTCITQTRLTEKGNSFQVSYADIGDALYKYRVTCIDDYGNEAEFFNQSLRLDSFLYISILSPKGPTHDLSHLFELTTRDNAICELRENGELKVAFTSTDQLTHKAGPFTLQDNRHYGNFRAVCRDLVDQTKIDEELFYFTIDNQAPIASAIVKTGRITTIANQSKQKVWVGEETTIEFDCKDPMIGSWGCEPSDVTYCITEADETCTPDKVYSKPLSLTSTGKIMYYAKDKGNNIEDVKEVTLSVGEVPDIFLVTPPYNVSNQKTFDVIIQTRYDAKECKFSGANFKYEAITDSAQIFQSLGNNQFKVDNFPNRLGLQFSDDGDSYPMNVKCKDSEDIVEPQATLFTLVYDPSAPKITDKGARPNPVPQGPHVTLYTETDDKTICKLDDNSANYNDMDLGFEGYEDYGKIFFLNSAQPSFVNYHEHKIVVNSQDSGKSFTYNVACQNRAGDLTSTDKITYKVDFSATGTIVETLPSGGIKDSKVDLKVITNKDATCEFQDGVSWTAFQTTGGTEHTIFKDVGKEGKYQFPVRCKMSVAQTQVTGEIKFIVDKTPPKMEIIDDGNVACGDFVQPTFHATDTHSDIAKYNYSLTDDREVVLIRPTVTDSHNPKITITNFEIGKKYLIKASPIDEAGNHGNTITSDGFILEEAGSVKCQDDSDPQVTLKKEDTYKGVKVTLECKDSTGCADKLYGISYDNESCEAKDDYESPVYMTDSGTFCYEVSDTAGNTITGSEKITVEDKDQDGVPDSKDRCKNTLTGELVDEEGCSSTQKENDVDRDGVENERDLCPETPADEAFDVDEDGCGPTERDQDDDGVPNNGDECENTKFGEQVDEKGCSDSQKDSDKDGMDDAWEKRHGLDPNDPADALDDSDKDGLTNKEEYDYYIDTDREIDPNNKDTDDDGSSDFEEKEAGTDPTDSDDYPDKTGVFPIILLILGILLSGGGTGYLIYLKQIEVKKQAPLLAEQKRQQQLAEARRRAYLEQQRRIQEERKRAFEEEQKRKYLEKAHKLSEAKQKKRKKFFGVFGGEEPAPKPQPKTQPEPQPKREELSPEFKKIVELTEKRTKKPVKLKKGDEFESLKDLIETRLKTTRGKSKVEQKSDKQLFNKIQKLSKRENVFKELKSMGIKTKRGKKK